MNIIMTHPPRVLQQHLHHIPFPVDTGDMEGGESVSSVASFVGHRHVHKRDIDPPGA